MRFRKRPKIVDAVLVSDCLSGTKMPDWFIFRLRCGKLKIVDGGVNIIIGNSLKQMHPRDWIAYDLVQGIAYGISQRTMAEDYEPAEGVKV